MPLTINQLALTASLHPSANQQLEQKSLDVLVQKLNSINQDLVKEDTSLPMFVGPAFQKLKNKKTIESDITDYLNKALMDCWQEISNMLTKAKCFQTLSISKAIIEHKIILLESISTSIKKVEDIIQYDTTLRDMTSPNPLGHSKSHWFLLPQQRKLQSQIDIIHHSSQVCLDGNLNINLRLLYDLFNLLPSLNGNAYQVCVLLNTFLIDKIDKLCSTLDRYRTDINKPHTPSIEELLKNTQVGPLSTQIPAWFIDRIGQ